MGSKVVYGKPLILAHELELSKALYPRIILRDRIKEMIARHKTNGKILKKHCWNAFYHNKFCESFIKHKLNYLDIEPYLIQEIHYIGEDW